MPQMPPDIPITATPLVYASGVAGIKQTVRLMRQLVEQGKRSPEIIKAARSIVYLQPEKSELHEINALFEYVRDQIRYTRDVYDVETLSDAVKTLQCKCGDCDDKVILLCSLFEAVGYPTRFVVGGYSDASVFEHVYCQVDSGSFWIDCDPTEPHLLGWVPPDPQCIAYERR